VKPRKANVETLVGLDAPDDAGVYRIAPDLALVQTVDFFTPIVDDPYSWGRIAAANALSDVYAMGGTPVTALSLVAWPRALDFELLGRVLDGGVDACEEAGCTLVGGHSVDDPEPKFGLAVTGTVSPDAIVLTTGATPGADLILTKALGTGIIGSAIKAGEAGPEVERATIDSMTRLNRAAAEAMVETGVESATDVTGFGLIGHLREMLGAGLDAVLHFDAIPLLPGAVELAGRGIFPGGSKRNLESEGRSVESPGLDDARRALLFDAQTSGGLLMAVRPERTGALLDALARRDVTGAGIGTLGPGTGTVRVVA
jgi:selenide,water dikinase